MLVDSPATTRASVGPIAAERCSSVLIINYRSRLESAVMRNGARVSPPQNAVSSLILKSPTNAHPGPFFSSSECGSLHDFEVTQECAFWAAFLHPTWWVVPCMILEWPRIVHPGRLCSTPESDSPHDFGIRQEYAF